MSIGSASDGDLGIRRIVHHRETKQGEVEVEVEALRLARFAGHGNRPFKF